MLCTALCGSPILNQPSHLPSLVHIQTLMAAEEKLHNGVHSRYYRLWSSTPAGPPWEGAILRGRLQPSPPFQTQALRAGVALSWPFSTTLSQQKTSTNGGHQVQRCLFLNLAMMNLIRVHVHLPCHLRGPPALLSRLHLCLCPPLSSVALVLASLLALLPTSISGNVCERPLPW